MFYPVSRVEPISDGLRFYEKDILLCQYLLTGNAEIEVEAAFAAPGLGVVFMEDNADPLNADRGFLIKVGYNDCSILQKSFTNTVELKHLSCLAAPPIGGMKIKFCKEGRMLSAIYNGSVIASAAMPHDLDEFHFGIYSNAGNVIKKVTVFLDAPKEWLSEVNNTNGGILYFKRNKIEMVNGEHDVEIETRPFVLTPGRYYLNGSFSGNMEPYIFPSNSTSEDDDAKNILDNKAFTVDQAREYSLKIKGVSGTVENLNVSTDENSAFVATVNGGETIEGSYLTFKLDDVKRVKWTGEIRSVQDGDYVIIDTLIKKYKLNDLGIALDKVYEYDFDVTTSTLSINGEEHIISLRNKENLKIFHNVDASITSIIVIGNDDKENNIMLRTTQKTYVPASVSGPILVVDGNNLPYDLSASYRIKNGTYLFTNYEREVFDPSTEAITPSHAVNEIMQSFKLYGIRNDSIINDDAIYNIEDDDNIKLYAPQFELIDPSKYTYKYGSFETDESIKEYKQVVLDYLKDRSYCINYNGDLNSYEIDISSIGEDFHVLTDNGERPYLITDLKPNGSKFIVLAKEAVV